jgi:ABC-type transport system involved in cytochrome c biogenesis ATPase subunit
MYRNILDSSDVAFESDITCFVGKNESGKTSFISALTALNPVVGESVNLMNYPAWLKKQHTLEGIDVSAVAPVIATFELSDSEREELRQELGGFVEPPSVITTERTYGDDLFIDFEFSEKQWVGAFIEDSCEGIGLEAVHTTSELAAQLADASSGSDSDPDARATAYKRLQELAGPTLDPRDRAREWMESNLPRFMYVGRYNTLPGEIDIGRIAKATYDSLNNDERVAKSLLELSHVDINTAVGQEYESRKRELNDTANAITQQILEYWTQNSAIRVEMDFEQRPAKAQQHQGPWSKTLHVRLYDNEHMISLPFGERSGGFQWFFSFLCAFARFQRDHAPLVVLLDEPALGLHARAQADFLRYIEEKLSQSCQVVYTTHSPFMVQPKRLERVRLVEDKGKREGAKVSPDVLTSDPDTIFPLQGALGYDLAQSLFVGPFNLIVEGTSDLVYLQFFSELLEREGRTCLDPRCTIVPVGGAEKIATFAALLGSHVDATILIDSTKQGNQRLADLMQKGVLRKDRVIGVAEFTGASEADIEDLFESKEYLQLFNATFGTKHTLGKLKGKDPIVRRLARLQKMPRYDHGRPAGTLIRRSSEVFPEGLAPATLERFEAMFKRINGTLPQ